MIEVPFFDLKAQYLSIKSEIDTAIDQVLTEGMFIGGEPVIHFEESFTEYLGSDHGLSCGNGTDALE